LLEAMGVGAGYSDELDRLRRCAKIAALSSAGHGRVGPEAATNHFSGLEPGRARPISGRFQLEDGSKNRDTRDVASENGWRIMGPAGVAVRLPSARSANRRDDCRSLMICAPETAYSEKRGAKRWEFFVPIYACIQGELGSWRPADFEQISSWVASLGGSLGDVAGDDGISGSAFRGEPVLARQAGCFGMSSTCMCLRSRIRGVTESQNWSDLQLSFERWISFAKAGRRLCRGSANKRRFWN